MQIETRSTLRRYKDCNGWVVVIPLKREVDYILDEIANFTATTGLVTMQEVSVGQMAGGTHIIILPLCLTPEAFVRAIPQNIWDAGFTFKT
jgi:hypothetical protein